MIASTEAWVASRDDGELVEGQMIHSLGGREVLWMTLTFRPVGDVAWASRGWGFGGIQI